MAGEAAPRAAGGMSSEETGDGGEDDARVLDELQALRDDGWRASRGNRFAAGDQP